MWFMLGASSEDERLALLLRRQQLEAEALALRHRSELAAFHQQAQAQAQAEAQVQAQVQAQAQAHVQAHVQAQAQMQTQAQAQSQAQVDAQTEMQVEAQANAHRQPSKSTFETLIFAGGRTRPMASEVALHDAASSAPCLQSESAPTSWGSGGGGEAGADVVWASSEPCPFYPPSLASHTPHTMPQPSSCPVHVPASVITPVPAPAPPSFPVPTTTPNSMAAPAPASIPPPPTTPTSNPGVVPNTSPYTRMQDSSMARQLGAGQTGEGKAGAGNGQARSLAAHSDAAPPPCRHEELSDKLDLLFAHQLQARLQMQQKQKQIRMQEYVLHQMAMPACAPPPPVAIAHVTAPRTTSQLSQVSSVGEQAGRGGSVCAAAAHTALHTSAFVASCVSGAPAPKGFPTTTSYVPSQPDASVADAAMASPTTTLATTPDQAAKGSRHRIPRSAQAVQVVQHNASSQASQTVQKSLVAKSAQTVRKMQATQAVQANRTVHPTQMAGETSQTSQINNPGKGIQVACVTHMGDSSKMGQQGQVGYATQTERIAQQWDAKQSETVNHSEQAKHIGMGIQVGKAIQATQTRHVSQPEEMNDVTKQGRHMTDEKLLNQTAKITQTHHLPQSSIISKGLGTAQVNQKVQVCDAINIGQEQQAGRTARLGHVEGDINSRATPNGQSNQVQDTSKLEKNIQTTQETRIIQTIQVGKDPPVRQGIETKHTPQVLEAIHEGNVFHAGQETESKESSNSNQVYQTGHVPHLGKNIQQVQVQQSQQVVETCQMSKGIEGNKVGQAIHSKPSRHVLQSSQGTQHEQITQASQVAKTGHLTKKLETVPLSQTGRLIQAQKGSQPCPILPTLQSSELGKALQSGQAIQTNDVTDTRQVTMKLGVSHAGHLSQTGDVRQRGEPMPYRHMLQSRQTNQGDLVIQGGEVSGTQKVNEPRQMTHSLEGTEVVHVPATEQVIKAWEATQLRHVLQGSQATHIGHVLQGGQITQVRQVAETKHVTNALEGACVGHVALTGQILQEQESTQARRVLQSEQVTQAGQVMHPGEVSKAHQMTVTKQVTKDSEGINAGNVMQNRKVNHAEQVIPTHQVTEARQITQIEQVTQAFHVTQSQQDSSPSDFVQMEQVVPNWGGAEKREDVQVRGVTQSLEANLMRHISQTKQVIQASEINQSKHVIQATQVTHAEQVIHGGQMQTTNHSPDPKQTTQTLEAIQVGYVAQTGQAIQIRQAAQEMHIAQSGKVSQVYQETLADQVIQTSKVTRSDQVMEPKQTEQVVEVWDASQAIHVTKIEHGAQDVLALQALKLATEEQRIPVETMIQKGNILQPRKVIEYGPTEVVSSVCGVIVEEQKLSTGKITTSEQVTDLRQVSAERQEFERERKIPLSFVAGPMTHSNDVIQITPTAQIVHEKKVLLTGDVAQSIPFTQTKHVFGMGEKIDIILQGDTGQGRLSQHVIREKHITKTGEIPQADYSGVTEQVCHAAPKLQSASIQSNRGTNFPETPTEQTGKYCEMHLQVIKSLQEMQINRSINYQGYQEQQLQEQNKCIDQNKQYQNINSYQGKQDTHHCSNSQVNQPQLVSFESHTNNPEITSQYRDSYPNIPSLNNREYHELHSPRKNNSQDVQQFPKSKSEELHKVQGSNIQNAVPANIYDTEYRNIQCNVMESQQNHSQCIQTVQTCDFQSTHSGHIQTNAHVLNSQPNSQICDITQRDDNDQVLCKQYNAQSTQVTTTEKLHCNLHGQQNEQNIHQNIPRFQDTIKEHCTTREGAKVQQNFDREIMLLNAEITQQPIPSSTIKQQCNEKFILQHQLSTQTSPEYESTAPRIIHQLVMSSSKEQQSNDKPHSSVKISQISSNQPLSTSTCSLKSDISSQWQGQNITQNYQPTELNDKGIIHSQKQAPLAFSNLSNAYQHPSLDQNILNLLPTSVNIQQITLNGSYTSPHYMTNNQSELFPASCISYQQPDITASINKEVRSMVEIKQQHQQQQDPSKYQTIVQSVNIHRQIPMSENTSTIPSSLNKEILSKTDATQQTYITNKPQIYTPPINKQDCISTPNNQEMIGKVSIQEQSIRCMPNNQENVFSASNTPQRFSLNQNNIPSQGGNQMTASQNVENKQSSMVNIEYKLSASASNQHQDNTRHNYKEFNTTTDIRQQHTKSDQVIISLAQSISTPLPVDPNTSPHSHQQSTSQVVSNKVASQIAGSQLEISLQPTNQREYITAYTSLELDGIATTERQPHTSNTNCQEMLPPATNLKTPEITNIHHQIFLPSPNQQVHISTQRNQELTGTLTGEHSTSMSNIREEIFQAGALQHHLLDQNTLNPSPSPINQWLTVSSEQPHSLTNAHPINQQQEIQTTINKDSVCITNVRRQPQITSVPGNQEKISLAANITQHILPMDQNTMNISPLIINQEVLSKTVNIGQYRSMTNTQHDSSLQSINLQEHNTGHDNQEQNGPAVIKQQQTTYAHKNQEGTSPAPSIHQYSATDQNTHNIVPQSISQQQISKNANMERQPQSLTNIQSQRFSPSIIQQQNSSKTSEHTLSYEATIDHQQTISKTVGQEKTSPTASIHNISADRNPLNLLPSSQRISQTVYTEQQSSVTNTEHKESMPFNKHQDILSLNDENINYISNVQQQTNSDQVTRVSQKHPVNTIHLSPCHNQQPVSQTTYNEQSSQTPNTRSEVSHLSTNQEECNTAQRNEINGMTSNEQRTMSTPISREEVSTANVHRYLSMGQNEQSLSSFSTNQQQISQALDHKESSEITNIQQQTSLSSSNQQECTSSLTIQETRKVAAIQPQLITITNNNQNENYSVRVSHEQNRDSQNISIQSHSSGNQQKMSTTANIEHTSSTTHNQYQFSPLINQPDIPVQCFHLSSTQQVTSSKTVSELQNCTTNSHHQSEIKDNQQQPTPSTNQLQTNSTCFTQEMTYAEITKHGLQRNQRNIAYTESKEHHSEDQNLNNLPRSPTYQKQNTAMALSKQTSQMKTVQHQFPTADLNQQQNSSVLTNQNQSFILDIPNNTYGHRDQQHISHSDSIHVLPQITGSQQEVPSRPADQHFTSTNNNQHENSIPITYHNQQQMSRSFNNKQSITENSQQQLTQCNQQQITDKQGLNCSVTNQQQNITSTPSYHTEISHETTFQLEKNTLDQKVNNFIPSSLNHQLDSPTACNIQPSHTTSISSQSPPSPVNIHPFISSHKQHASHSECVQQLHSMINSQPQISCLQSEELLKSTGNQDENDYKSNTPKSLDQIPNSNSVNRSQLSFTQHQQYPNKNNQNIPPTSQEPKIITTQHGMPCIPRERIFQFENLPTEQNQLNTLPTTLNQVNHIQMVNNNQTSIAACTLYQTTTPNNQQNTTVLSNLDIPHLTSIHQSTPITSSNDQKISYVNASAQQILKSCNELNLVTVTEQEMHSKQGIQDNISYINTNQHREATFDQNTQNNPPSSLGTQQLSHTVINTNSPTICDHQNITSSSTNQPQNTQKPPNRFQNLPTSLNEQQTTHPDSYKQISFTNSCQEHCCPPTTNQEEITSTHSNQGVPPSPITQQQSVSLPTDEKRIYLVPTQPQFHSYNNYDYSLPTNINQQQTYTISSQQTTVNNCQQNLSPQSNKQENTAAQSSRELSSIEHTQPKVHKISNNQQKSTQIAAYQQQYPSMDNYQNIPSRGIEQQSFHIANDKQSSPLTNTSDELTALSTTQHQSTDQEALSPRNSYDSISSTKINQQPVTRTKNSQQQPSSEQQSPPSPNNQQKIAHTVSSQEINNKNSQQEQKSFTSMNQQENSPTPSHEKELCVNDNYQNVSSLPLSIQHTTMQFSNPQPSITCNITEHTLQHVKQCQNNFTPSEQEIPLVMVNFQQYSTSSTNETLAITKTVDQILYSDKSDPTTNTTQQSLTKLPDVQVGLSQMGTNQQNSILYINQQQKSSVKDEHNQQFTSTNDNEQYSLTNSKILTPTPNNQHYSSINQQQQTHASSNQQYSSTTFSDLTGVSENNQQGTGAQRLDQVVISRSTLPQPQQSISHNGQYRLCDEIQCSPAANNERISLTTNENLPSEQNKSQEYKPASKQELSDLGDNGQFIPKDSNQPYPPTNNTASHNQQNLTSTSTNDSSYAGETSNEKHHSCTISNLPQFPQNNGKGQENTHMKCSEEELLQTDTNCLECIPRSRDEQQYSTKQNDEEQDPSMSNDPKKSSHMLDDQQKYQPDINNKINFETMMNDQNQSSTIPCNQQHIAGLQMDLQLPVNNVQQYISSPYDHKNIPTTTCNQEESISKIGDKQLYTTNNQQGSPSKVTNQILSTPEYLHQYTQQLISSHNSQDPSAKPNNEQQGPSSSREIRPSTPNNQQLVSSNISDELESSLTECNQQQYLSYPSNHNQNHSVSRNEHIASTTSIKQEGIPASHSEEFSTAVEQQCSGTLNNQQTFSSVTRNEQFINSTYYPQHPIMQKEKEQTVPTCEHLHSLHSNQNIIPISVSQEEMLPIPDHQQQITLTLSDPQELLVKTSTDDTYSSDNHHSVTMKHNQPRNVDNSSLQEVQTPSIDKLHSVTPSPEQVPQMLNNTNIIHSCGESMIFPASNSDLLPPSSILSSQPPSTSNQLQSLNNHQKTLLSNELQQSPTHSYQHQILHPSINQQQTASSISNTEHVSLAPENVQENQHSPSDQVQSRQLDNQQKMSVMDNKQKSSEPSMPQSPRDQQLQSHPHDSQQQGLTTNIIQQSSTQCIPQSPRDQHLQNRTYDDHQQGQPADINQRTSGQCILQPPRDQLIQTRPHDAQQQVPPVDQQTSAQCRPHSPRDHLLLSRLFSQQQMNSTEINQQSYRPQSPSEQRQQTRLHDGQQQILLTDINQQSSAQCRPQSPREKQLQSRLIDGQEQIISLDINQSFVQCRPHSPCEQLQPMLHEGQQQELSMEIINQHQSTQSLSHSGDQLKYILNDSQQKISSISIDQNSSVQSSEQQNTVASNHPSSQRQFLGDPATENTSSDTQTLIADRPPSMTHDSAPASSTLCTQGSELIAHISTQPVASTPAQSVSPTNNTSSSQSAPQVVTSE